jgi:hypothetical protein
MIEHLAEVTLPTLYAFVLTMIVYWSGMIRERRRQPPPPKAPNLQCGCYHGLNFHDGLGPCRHAEMVQTGNSKFKQVNCVCQQYTGDVPADWYGRAVMREMDGGASLPELPAPSTEEERKAS